MSTGGTGGGGGGAKGTHTSRVGGADDLNFLVSFAAGVIPGCIAYTEVSWSVPDGL